MTEFEIQLKASKYCDTNRTNRIVTYVDAFYEGYKQGLEKRSDYCSQCENTSILQEQVEYFRKENEELKKEVISLRTTGQDEYINALEEQYEELKERLRIESQSLHEQCEIVSKQVEQIEKMKSCYTCKHSPSHTPMNIIECTPNDKYKNCKNKNKWELAE